MPSVRVGLRPAIEVAGLRKAYGGVRALDGVDLTVEPGSVHAIVGENGAGKSTLMKILAGAVRPDTGEIRVDGELLATGSPNEARRRGVGIVYQELSLFPDRSILANLFPHAPPHRLGFVDTDTMIRNAEPVLERLGLAAPPETLVGNLGVAERQLVELARLLIRQPRVLILDEPNSALNERETVRLFSLLRELTANGITIIYVSHRLAEVFDIADQITVMRNGRVIMTEQREDTTMSAVVEAMVGGARTDLFPPHPAPQNGGRSIAVRDAVALPELEGVTFDAHDGEIVGLVGLEGSGVSAMLEVLFGTRRLSSGTVAFADGAPAPASPHAAARRGISLVPADRRNHGLMLESSVEANIAHVSVGALKASRLWLSPSRIRDAAVRQIEALRISPQDSTAGVAQLSGGNQQKVVLGKWLEISPAIFLLDDPTRGVDVGAKREIYRLIRALADKGRTVLFRSTEHSEIIGLADRILVFYKGRMVLELEGGGVDESALLHAINTGRLPAKDDNYGETEEVPQ